MVRALLDGTKTQTRRVVKGLTDKMWIEATAAGGFAVCYDGEPSCGTGVWEVPEHSHPIACPYGQPGDRLWVRESLGYDPEWGHKWADGKYLCEVFEDAYSEDNKMPDRGIPSIHVPRRYSRIDLEITGVRVERLMDCSNVDAIDEGVLTMGAEWLATSFPEHHAAVADWKNRDEGTRPPLGPSPVQRYARLWEQINGAGSWDLNPWVWVVEFRMVRT